MTTKDLIDALAAGDATGIETTFNAAMAERISAKIDDMRTQVAQSMFAATQEEVEQTNEVEIAEEYTHKMSGTVKGENGKSHEWHLPYNDKHETPDNLSHKEITKRVHSFSHGIPDTHAKAVADHFHNSGEDHSVQNNHHVHMHDEVRKMD